MSEAARLKKALDDCPVGKSTWKQFEDICTEVLQYLFCPPLESPIEQARTYSSVNRRDMVFPNRNLDEGKTPAEKNWHLLFSPLSLSRAQRWNSAVPIPDGNPISRAVC